MSPAIQQWHQEYPRQVDCHKGSFVQLELTMKMKVMKLMIKINLKKHLMNSLQKRMVRLGHWKTLNLKMMFDVDAPDLNFLKLNFGW